MKKLLIILLAVSSCLASPPPGYYDFAIGQTGEYLRDALHSIIRGHTVVSYSNTESALMRLDQDPANSNNVMLLYAQRSEPKTNFGTIEGWNREHMWPNSYGLDSSGPEYSDLFNLRAEDATVNSSRGNKFYDIGNVFDPNFRNPAHEEALDCVSDTDSWSPPFVSRGDVARAMFYMDVRYSGEDGEPDLILTSNLSHIQSDTNFMGRLAMLLRWHIEDPVDDAERLRNDLIFTEYQHNRNPFVDHPEWVESVFWPQLRVMISQPNPEIRPGLQFYWSSIHFGARLEESAAVGGPWLPVPGEPAMEDPSEFTQYNFPLQCDDLDACIEYFRLNVLPHE